MPSNSPPKFGLTTPTGPSGQLERVCHPSLWEAVAARVQQAGGPPAESWSQAWLGCIGVCEGGEHGSDDEVRGV
jgi:hypothetical protein